MYASVLMSYTHICICNNVFLMATKLVYAGDMYTCSMDYIIYMSN